MLHKLAEFMTYLDACLWLNLASHGPVRLLVPNHVVPIEIVLSVCFFVVVMKLECVRPTFGFLHNMVIRGEELGANSPCHQRNFSSPKRSVSSIEASKHFAHTHNSQVLKGCYIQRFCPHTKPCALAPCCSKQCTMTSYACGK